MTPREEAERLFKDLEWRSWEEAVEMLALIIEERNEMRSILRSEAGVYE